MDPGRPNEQYCFGTARPERSAVHSDSLSPSPAASTMAQACSRPFTWELLFKAPTFAVIVGFPPFFQTFS